MTVSAAINKYREHIESGDRRGALAALAIIHPHWQHYERMDAVDRDLRDQSYKRMQDRRRRMGL